MQMTSHRESDDVIASEDECPSAAYLNVREPIRVAKTMFRCLSAPAPFRTSDDDRQAVRDLLRHGGFKPTGRSKPAADYRSKAASDGKLSHINLAVDVGTVVSLQTDS